MIENIVDVFQAFFDSRMEDVHTCIPGTIDSYDGHTKRTSSVKPMVKLKALSGEDVELPIIQNVPVMFPSSSSFNLVFPLVKGDGVLLLFSETGIGNYLAGTGQVVNADDRTRFSLTDAIAIPGLWTTKTAPTAKTIELTDAGILQFFEGERSTVAFDKLKEGFDQLKSDFNDLVTAYNSHIHITTATVGATATPGVISATTSTGTPSSSSVDDSEVAEVTLP